VQVGVVDESGKKIGSGMKVSDKNFGTPFNGPLVHQIVVAYQAGGRAGTRAQKNRALVRGGGAKPWRQKGTGHARAGTIRSPLWRGGGVAFPAQTKNFAQKINKKMYRAAIRSILSELVRQDRLLVIKDLSMDAPKTKTLVEKLNRLGVSDVLIISDKLDMNLALSARNLPTVEVRDVSASDPVSLIRFDKVIMTVAALEKFEEWLS